MRCAVSRGLRSSVQGNGGSLTHFDKETSLQQLALGVATDSGVFEFMVFRTHVCDSGDLETSCHAMTMMGNASKEVTSKKRAKFGRNSRMMVVARSQVSKAWPIRP